MSTASQRVAAAQKTKALCRGARGGVRPTFTSSLCPHLYVPTEKCFKVIIRARASIRVRVRGLQSGLGLEVVKKNF